MSDGTKKLGRGKKGALGIAGGLVALIGGAVGLGTVMKPAQRPAADITIERTPERIARGSYLANAVFPCMHCHSKLDPEQYGGHTIAGTEGAGGDCFGREMGLPGRVCPSNITPDVETGIGGWTDGEILRAMREGVSKDGHGLFALMPTELFRQMPDEDAYAVVAYLRTLTPIKNKVEPKEIDFPVNILFKLGIKPLVGPVPEIPQGDRLAQGKYLSLACYKCHTPFNENGRGSDLARLFAGGREFRNLHGVVVQAPNLTFHQETGQGARTKEQFVSMFKAYRGLAPVKVTAKDNTFMPWVSYSGMTDEDLGLIYDYLQSLPRIENKVERRPQVPAVSASR